ncbi:MAG: type II secretion system F family protein [Isosphaeraceae bacterium]|nr:type II secretion system F family protein [Isosphaeraceae bacterium]
MPTGGNNQREEGRLSDEEVARLTEQIAGLSQASLPLPSGLRALAEEQPSRRLRRVLEHLADQLDAGVPLEEALANAGDRVPAHLRGIVTSGVRAGKLSYVLGHYAEYATIGTDLRKRLLLDLSYPMIAWCLALVLLFFLWGVIAHSFERIYMDFGVPLPGLTKLVLGASRLMRTYWWVLANLVALGLIVVLLCRIILKPAERFSLVCRVPLFGRVWRWTSLAEWCHLLALLIESRLPLHEAVALTGDGICDADVGRASRFIGQDIAGGETLARALVRVAIFPVGLERMLGWAERNRGLPEALHMAGELFESRARAQSSVINAICSVLTFIFILLLVVVTVFALFFPMFSLLTKLSG